MAMAGKTLDVRALLSLRSGLIVAIDEEDAARSVAIAASVAGGVDAIKVGYPTVLAAGIGIVGRLKAAAGAPIVCDFKVADIPPVAAKIAARAVDAGASAVIAHAFAGSDSLQAVVEAAHRKGAAAIAVVEMSHEGGKEFTQPAMDRLLDAALAVGIDAVVAPATRPDRIRRVRSRAPTLAILATGAGTQGGSAAEAAKAGADFVIVGRSVSQAKDPAEAARAAAAEIARGRAAR
jgi:orotidine-5'-phosphate decarboxylase